MSTSINRTKRLEAVLFLENKPVDKRKLCGILEIEPVEADSLINQINKQYTESNSVFHIKSSANAWQLTLSSSFSDTILDRYTLKKKKQSKAVLETLGIIVYKQPVTKAEIETIRGVNSAQYIKQLSDDDFIKIAGKKNAPGRPVMYRTTQKFLSHFGLESLNDLPTIPDIRSFEFLNNDHETDGPQTDKI